MSNEAITWAIRQPVGRSSAKFVLVAMANLAGPDMKCWPSTAYLCDATEQDRKTVQENLRRLREAGFIVPTEDRAGRTGQVVVYELKTPENGPLSTTPTDPETGPKTDTKTPENGPVEQAQKRASCEIETGPFFPPNRPKNGQKQARFSRKEAQKRATDTKDTNDTTRTPKEEIGDFFGGALVDVDPVVLADFRKLRTKLKAPLTDTAVAGLVREAAKARMTLTEVMRMCCERSWRGFKAEWAMNDRGRPNTPSRHTGFDQRDYEGAPDGHIPA